MAIAEEFMVTLTTGTDLMRHFGYAECMNLRSKFVRVLKPMLLFWHKCQGIFNGEFTLHWGHVYFRV